MEKKVNTDKSEATAEKKVTANKPEAVEKKVKNAAQKMWDEIKDKEILMFSLPNQMVSQYCQPVDIEPTKLYLLTTASSVLPSLEAAIGNKFSVERVDKFVVVSRAEQLQHLKK